MNYAQKIIFDLGASSCQMRLKIIRVILRTFCPECGYRYNACKCSDDLAVIDE